MSGDELYQVLACVPGVDRVYWQTYKSAQGNHSQRNLGTPYMGVGHLLERHVFVKSKVFKREFEFELTRSMHTRTMGTCSMVLGKLQKASCSKRGASYVTLWETEVYLRPACACSVAARRASRC